MTLVSFYSRSTLPGEVYTLPIRQKRTRRNDANYSIEDKELNLSKIIFHKSQPISDHYAKPNPE